MLTSRMCDAGSRAFAYMRFRELRDILAKIQGLA